MGVADPYLAYVFDEAIAIRMTLREQRAANEDLPQYPGAANPTAAPGRASPMISGSGRITGTLSGRIGEAL
jgi:hypothetical protein